MEKFSDLDYEIADILLERLIRWEAWFPSERCNKKNWITNEQWDMLLLMSLDDNEGIG